MSCRSASSNARDRRLYPSVPDWQPTPTPDGSAPCSTHRSGGRPPLHQVRFRCEHQGSLRSARVVPAPQLPFERESLVKHPPSPRSVRIAPAPQLPFERESLVRHPPSPRSVRIVPAPQLPFERVGSARHPPPPPWVRVAPAPRQQLEQEYSVRHRMLPSAPVPASCRAGLATAEAWDVRVHATRIRHTLEP